CVPKQSLGTRVSRSLSEMPRFSQHVLAGGLLLLVILLSLGLLEPAPIPSPAQAARPAVDFANYTETIPGSKTTFDMIAVKGGTYAMGSPAGEAERGADEGPQHPITVRPFWMGKCEVSWDEFDLWWKRDPAYKPVTDADKAADAISRPTPPYVDETYGH